MRVLVVDDEVEIQEIMAFMLESQFKAEVVRAGSGNKAIQILEVDQKFDCIVCDQGMSDGNGASVYRYIKTRNLTIPYVLCSTHTPASLQYFHQNPPQGFIQKPNLFPELQNLLQKLTTKVLKPAEENEYCQIRPDLVLKEGVLEFDLYIKLLANTKKFVRAFKKGDVLENSDFLWFEGKKIDTIYLKAEDASLVLKLLTLTMHELNQKAPAEKGNTIEISHKTLDSIMGYSRAFGFKAEVRALTEQSVKSVISTIEQDQKLSNLFSRFMIDPEQYLVSHSIVLSHLSCGIASLLNWGSEINLTALAMAAFFHDVTLANDELARIHTLVELESSGGMFNSEEKERFKNHPEAGAAQVDQLPDPPSFVSTIISQHHERPDGTGFPKKLMAKDIHQLAAVFIVAEELLSKVKDRDSINEIRAFLKNLGPSFQQEPFKRILEVMANSVK